MSADEVAAYVARELGPEHGAVKLGRVWLVTRLDRTGPTAQGSTLERAVAAYRRAA